MVFVREGTMRPMRGERADMTGLGRKLACWLAMAALLAQLVATAGHFHPEDFSMLGGTPTVASTAGPEGTASHSGIPVLPRHDDCALCFSLHVANGSAVPDAALLPVPNASSGLQLEGFSARRLHPAPHLLFETRAPPTA
jgi:hypothetical protein